jgi:hypothetical protein
MESNDEEGKGILPVQFSEHLSDKDTNKEMESFLKQELIRGKNLSQNDVLQKQDGKEQTFSITDANHANVTKEEVDSLAAVKNCMQIETKSCQKQNDMFEKSPGKHAHNNNANKKIEYDVGITGENVGESSMEGMELPDDLSESKTGERDNPSVVPTKVKEVVAEEKSVKMPSPEMTPLGPLWGNYILSLKGIPPREAWVS